MVLSYGAHAPGSGETCLIEAARVAAGEVHGDLIQDDPTSCIGSECATFGRVLSDVYGEGLEADQRRTEALTPLVPLLIGTRGAVEGHLKWWWADSAVRRWAPLALEAAGLRVKAERLRNLPPIVDAASAADAAEGVYIVTRAIKMAEVGVATARATAAAARATAATARAVERTSWVVTRTSGMREDVATEAATAVMEAMKAVVEAVEAVGEEAEEARYAVLDGVAVEWAEALTAAHAM